MKYEKINTLWKRAHPKDSKKMLITPGQYSKEEFGLIIAWEVTEKIDGTNVRVICTEDSIEVRGKSDNAQRVEPLFTRLEEYFTRHLIDYAFKWDNTQSVILYGEGYGPKIQTGGKYRDEQSFILFDVLIDDKIWFDSDHVTEIAKTLGIDRVPIIGMMLENEIEDFVKSRPQSLIGKDGCIMEGVVCRTKPLLLDRLGNRIIFKLKVRDFEELEKFGD